MFSNIECASYWRTGDEGYTVPLLKLGISGPITLHLKENDVFIFVFAAVVTAGAVRTRRDLDDDYEYGFAPEKNESGGLSPNQVGSVSWQN